MRRLLPRVELGRVSAASLTNGQPGDGWYVAAQWLGWRVLLAVDEAA